jgi:hypothetical protein
MTRQCRYSPEAERVRVAVDDEWCRATRRTAQWFGETHRPLTADAIGMILRFARVDAVFTQEAVGDDVWAELSAAARADRARRRRRVGNGPRRMPAPVFCTLIDLAEALEVGLVGGRADVDPAICGGAAHDEFAAAFATWLGPDGRAQLEYRSARVSRGAASTKLTASARAAAPATAGAT